MTLSCHNVTHVDLSARSGCHSHVTEIKVVFFFNFFIYLLTILLVLVVSLVSVVLFVSFWSFCFGHLISLFWVLVHAY